MYNYIIYRNFPYFTIFLIVLVLVGGFIQKNDHKVHADDLTGMCYYVSKNGSDSNSGTETKPWLTIQFSIEQLSTGDTLLVKAGVYNELIEIISRPDHLTLKAFPGDTPVIDGTGLITSTGIVTIRNTQYLTIEGFEIAHTTAHTGGYGLYAYRSIDNLTLKNLTIHDINKGGLLLNGCYTHNGNATTPLNGSVTNVIIDSCEIYDTNRIIPSNELLSLMRVKEVEVKNSKFHDPGLNPLDRPAEVPSTLIGKDCVDIKNGCANIFFHDNECFGSGYEYGNGLSGTCWDGIYIDCFGENQDNIKVYNNYFHDSRAGVQLGCESGTYANLTDVDIFNNVFYNNQYALRIYGHDFTRNYRFINNTCYHNYYTIVEHANEGINQDCVIRNNILYGESRYDGLINILSNLNTVGIPIIDHNVFFQTNTSWPSYKLTDLIREFSLNDPLFAEAPADFSLQTISPAIDAGSVDLAPSHDKIGVSRPLGVEIDIGAFEHFSMIPTIDFIIITPSDPLISIGGTQIFTAQAYDTENNEINGLSYEWFLMDPLAGSIESDGLFTAGTIPGNFLDVLKVVADGHSTTISLTITPLGGQSDVNQDGQVNVLDMILVEQHLGESGHPGWIAEDVNRDGFIDVLDKILIGQNWTET